jgi:hypothetical protein
LLERILPKILKVFQKEQQQGKGLKGKGIAAVTLLTNWWPRCGGGPLSLRLAFARRPKIQIHKKNPEKFSFQGKGEIFSFACPTRPCAQNTF